MRTGCLKALTFVFEYVGPQSAYYCDSVVTMLEDALTDRDLVDHRQTASTIVKHLALGVAGLGCEDYATPDEHGYCADRLCVSRPFGTSTGLPNSMFTAALR